MKLKYLAFLLLPATLLVACGADDSVIQQAPVADAVATVNGKAITQGQLDVYARRRAGQSTPEDMINDLISIELLAQVAERDGTAQDETIAAELAAHRAATLAQAVVRARLDANPITDEQVQAEYERFTTEDLGEELNARHILVQEEALARQLITQLDDGADFAELAREHSQDGSSQNGGDLGWFDQSMMVEPFGATAAALEIGAYTANPVQTRFGWHVIKLDGRRSADAPPIEEIREEIVGFLQAQMIENWVNELRGEATIEIR